MKKAVEFMKKAKKKILVVALSLGLLISAASFVDNTFEVSKNLDIFATLFRELNLYYVDDVKPGDLMKKGIDAMLETLDPYTEYYPESAIEDYKFMLTGQYGGIGAAIRQKGDYVIVAEPYQGFPAYKADIRAGDIILEVNGTPAKGKKTEDVTKILKGTPNTQVKVLIQREGEAKPIEKTLMREEIKIKNVRYYGMITDSIGYIKLGTFTENAADEVKDAVVALKQKGMKSLVFDLRGNGGGLLREAVDIVNLFVDKGQEIVSTRGKMKDWDKTHYASNAPLDTQTPIAMLVDRGSASASEIVSGSIQDLDRGVLIGQRTFGKGLVQQNRPLSYNTQLKVTVAKYYIPSGRCIQALDYSNKAEDGSAEKVPDSLITAFKTKNGRIVYDGAGVLPDVVVELRKYSNILASLITKSLIFDYATKYRIANKTIPNAREFKLSDKDYQDFVAFLSGKEYDYTTKSEQLMKDLKDASEKEKSFEAIKSEYENLQTKMNHDKKEDLTKYKSEISEFLEEEIASRYYFQDGREEASMKYDDELAEAKSLLRNPTKYKSILTTINKPERPFNKVVLEKATSKK